MPQHPSPEDVKNVFDSYYKADNPIWEAFSEKITVREFKKIANTKRI